MNQDELKKIEARQSELAEERARLQEVSQEEQQLEFRKFQLQMEAINGLRNQAKQLEDSTAVRESDLIITANVKYKGEDGKEHTLEVPVDMTQESLREVGELKNLRHNIISQLAVFLRQQANKRHQLYTAGRADMTAKYNDLKRKEEQKARQKELPAQ